jgi:L-threonylcarbamoyladenylate synthase
VLDGGPCTHGIESTVVAVDEDPPRVLRPGALSLADLRSLLPDISFAATTVEEGEARASPGLASKHYAPRVRLTIAASGAIARVLGRQEDSGLVAWSDFARDAAPAGTRVVTLPDTADGYARGLYAALHELEAQRVSTIVVEDVPDEPAWWAVRDRLVRAAQD